jgi:hypothetical protein
VSYLRNPNFEESTAAPWRAINLASQITWGTSPDPRAMSGTRVLSIQTPVANGSVGQDAYVNALSVSCFAFVRTINPQPVQGALQIWQLDLESKPPSVTKFTANDQAWQLVANTMDLGYQGGQAWYMRFELYVATVNLPLIVDCVNAF